MTVSDEGITEMRLAHQFRYYVSIRNNLYLARYSNLFKV